MAEPDVDQGSAREGPHVERARLAAELAGLRDLIRLIAHDLNNPLQSMTLILELLELELGDDAARERVQQCVGGVLSMRSLVRDLSEFAREHASAVGVPTVESTIERVLQVAARRLTRHRVDIERETGGFGGEELPDAVDAGAVRSAVLNAVLGFMDVAAHGSAERYLLVLQTHDGALVMHLESAARPRAALALGAEHATRVLEACAGTRVRASIRDGTVRIGFAAPS